jgi:23S rRNA (guanosine2251-2'-O)-methyltransferase
VNARGKPKGSKASKGTKGTKPKGAKRSNSKRSPQSSKRGPRATQRGSTPVRAEGSKPTGVGGDHVEGRQAVRELLLADRRTVREVLLAGDLDPAPILDDIIDLADEHKVRIRQIGRSKFEAMTMTSASQGVLATAAPLDEVPVEDLTEPLDGRVPFVVCFDGVTDPGNLGALLRTAECAGVTGVVLPRHRSARVGPTVAKAAAGAIEHLRFATAPGMASAVSVLKKRGVWAVGLDAGGDQPIHSLSVADEPIALIFGAEGRGLSKLVRQRCDVIASIPQHGVLGSLNVAAAGAIACFEIARHRV